VKIFDVYVNGGNPIKVKGFYTSNDALMHVLGTSHTRISTIEAVERVPLEEFTDRLSDVGLTLKEFENLLDEYNELLKLEGVRV
jgi:hypothetical protein